MKKRILAILLAVLMMFSLLPVTAFAADHSTHDGIETPITNVGDLQRLFTNGGSGYLAEDITLTEALTVPEDVEVYLCLNGKVITQTEKVRVIEIAEGATLNLYDCGTTEHYGHVECIEGEDDDVTYSWKLDAAKEAGNICFTGGYITGGNVYDESGTFTDGGCVYTEGTFNMYGGNLVGNTAGTGGAVYVDESGSFTMRDGSITGNTARAKGGAVYTDGSFTMYDGSITDNTAAKGYGGAVYVYAHGSFTMYGGSITDNTADGGGGVNIEGSFTMYDGSITDNTAEGEGGGGICMVRGTAEIHGGDITGNTAAGYGSAIHGQTDSTEGYGDFSLKLLADEDNINITGNSSGMFGAVFFLGDLEISGSVNISENTSEICAPNLALAGDDISYELEYDGPAVATITGDLTGSSIYVDFVDLIDGIGSGAGVVTSGYTTKSGKTSENPDEFFHYDGPETNQMILNADGELEIVAPPVAEVSGKNYSSLKAAIAAAEEIDDATIKLLDNVSVKKTLNINSGSVTLDLNGYTLTGCYDEYECDIIFSVDSGVELTIVDGSEEQTGAVKASEDNEESIVFFSHEDESAAVSIEGGIYTCGEGMFSDWSDSVSITGGTFDFDPTDYVDEGYTVTENDDGTWTVAKEVKYKVFWQTPEYAEVTATTEDGTPIESGDEFAPYTDIVFTATPNEGYAYTEDVGDWTFNEERGTLTRTYTVEEDLALEDIPEPTEILYEVTWTNPDHATVTATVKGEEIENEARVANRTEIAFTVTPDEGYEYTEDLSDWNLEENGTLTGTYTVEDEDLTVPYIPAPTEKTAPAELDLSVMNGEEEAVSGEDFEWDGSEKILTILKDGLTVKGNGEASEATIDVAEGVTTLTIEDLTIENKVTDAYAIVFEDRSPSTLTVKGSNSLYAGGGVGFIGDGMITGSGNLTASGAGGVSCYGDLTLDCPGVIIAHGKSVGMSVIGELNVTGNTGKIIAYGVPDEEGWYGAFCVYEGVTVDSSLVMTGSTEYEASEDKITGETAFDEETYAVTVGGETAQSVLIVPAPAPAEEITFEGNSLLLDGDIGLYFWYDIPESMKDGVKAEMGIGSRNPRTEKKGPGYDSTSGLFSFPFNVNSIQMSETVTVTLKDSEGEDLLTNTGSVEEYNTKVQDSQSVSPSEKALVKALVNYGYYAQQSLSVANGWSIGNDYAKTAKKGEITATDEDIAKFKPIITGSSDNVTGINLRLALDNKTNFYIYFTTSDKEAPSVTIDGVTATLKQDGERFVATIPNIDALNLGTVHVIEADGYTLYLSPLSYGSTITGSADIDTVRALIDYYYAALTYAGRTVITSATADDATYTGEAIDPVLTVTDYAGNPVTDYIVEWDSELKEIGTHAGIVRGTKGTSGVVPVSFTINPKVVTLPTGYSEDYDGQEHNFTEDDYSNLTIVSGTEKAKDAGEYSVTVKPAAGCCWSDGTQDEVIIDWSIEKACVTVNADSVEKDIGDTDPKLTYDADELEALVERCGDTGNVRWTIELSREEGETRGDYNVVATVFEISGEAAKNYEVDFAGDLSFHISGEEVEEPSVSPISYDGADHEYTEAGNWSNYLDYIEGDNYATGIGDYSVTVQPGIGYCWADGTRVEKAFTWSIVSDAIMTSIVQ